MRVIGVRDVFPLELKMTRGFMLLNSLKKLFQWVFSSELQIDLFDNSTTTCTRNKKCFTPAHHVLKVVENVCGHFRSDEIIFNISFFVCYNSLWD